MQKVKSKKRYAFLDTCRGFLLLAMLVYHFFWDLTYLFAVELPWFEGKLAYLWQQSVCWAFILLSGFCFPLGTRPARRGLVLMICGVAIMLITNFFVPEQPALFGILFFLGSCMLFLAPLHQFAVKIPCSLGLLGSLALFVLTRNLNDGYLGFEQWNLYRLPQIFYADKLTTYLGFPEANFVSSDYFSLMPWLFLFMVGYYTFYLLQQEGELSKFFAEGTGSLSFLGRHSLLFYLLHQPVLYGILQLLLA